MIRMVLFFLSTILASHPLPRIMGKLIPGMGRGLLRHMEAYRSVGEITMQVEPQRCVLSHPLDV